MSGVCTGKAARYGGEEFIIILPETPQTGAEEVANRLHQLLKERDITHEYSDISKHLTVSIGIATMHPKKQDDPKYLKLLVDKELYKAKANGRNCTSLYEEIT